MSMWGSEPCPIPPPTPCLHDKPPSTSSSVGPRALIGTSSLANFGKGTENQDSFISSINTSGSKAFVGVFDGHGEKGSRLSHFAKHALANNLFNNQKLHSNPKSALDSAYYNTQAQISSSLAADANLSGTTAVSAYKHRDHLFVANVGDSRAVLGRCNTASSRAGSMVAIDLTSDHKPCRADEKKRVIDLGGRVEPGMMPVQNMFGGVSFVRAGPDRVIDQSGIGGLAMSRAFGDNQLRPYVISEPEVSEKKLDKNDKLLILGSDGVWDHISSQEAVNIASRHADPTAAAREITAAAKHRWAIETQGCLSDDITAVVMRLDHAKRKDDDGLGRLQSGSDRGISGRPISDPESGRSQSLVDVVGRRGSRGGHRRSHGDRRNDIFSDHSSDRGANERCSNRSSERSYKECHKEASSDRSSSVPWGKPRSLGRMATVPELPSGRSEFSSGRSEFPSGRSGTLPAGGRSLFGNHVPNHLLPPAGQQRRR